MIMAPNRFRWNQIMTDKWIEHTCHSHMSLSTAHSESYILSLEQVSRSLADTQNVEDLWC